MGSHNTDQHKHSIATFAALKTAIANDEEQLVKDLLANEPMQELEKSYLIDLANINNNQTILTLLKDIPEI
ncbi:hypothetical protein H5123_06030 [Shewanella sp. SR43-4]|jgi:hypothetical protein|uniref:Uncharacterized protein n=1 Tax=Shewanella vesiculosa TaxID=518738 RepID=A0ABV0FMY3_9GAMM|nr:MULTISPECIES: hypothetical protein [Shewanella]NCQ46118.1 hypothetical protein [Shewanella frigidimarina]MBB1317196.1 hypothetical protein [Shewanella sp. SR43-4]MBB1322079.1 hypothetical protein [Shewanella sp. SR43-8]NCO70576.1 hypothetical protein [Shewanella vesiculosa]NCP36352.1 hypothetical protein [Shewanella vesiculosa]|tara:strand:- start:584 stop:796 length:213 start_codon:yes stop_codon:yes gene_type:complete